MPPSASKKACLCCTGNEILMRQGVSIAGNELHSELAVVTGAVEAMVVDVQCIYPALAELSRCFHTKFISTSDQARFPGAIHIQFEEAKAKEVAEKIIELAIENFPHRDKDRVKIPDVREEAIDYFAVLWRGISGPSSRNLSGGGLFSDMKQGKEVKIYIDGRQYTARVGRPLLWPRKGKSKS